MSKQEMTSKEFVGPRINLEPLDGKVAQQIKDQMLELQLRMATSSINHEYARIEYDDTIDRERQEELLMFMEDCRNQYFDARSKLAIHNPYALEEFEADLMRQKQAAITTQFNA